MLDLSTALRSDVHRRSALHASVWLAAALVGIAAVLYAKLIAWAQGLYLEEFRGHPYLLTAMTPLLFVGAAGCVQRFGKEARGSGIPQVLEAIELSRHPDFLQRIWLHRLVSLRTAFIKVASSTLGIFGGASIGREGPTVQIAASLFAWIGGYVRRLYPGADFQSFVTAGAAAGVAAAFNTPLAGVTFALEEVVGGSFGQFKQLAILGVVIAGIVAQALSGNYLYFGHPAIPDANVLDLLPPAIVLGLVAGLAGGAFAHVLAHPEKLRLPGNWWQKALACGLTCALISLLTGARTAGSGYEVTREALEGVAGATPGIWFPVGKFAASVLSYLTGMAGGIFAPSLSIGAGIGMSFATLAHLSAVKACALLGMVAFFAGVVQAPLTAVVIVMEMTDQHALILPFMAAAFIGQGAGKVLMPTPLYHHLAARAKAGWSPGPATLTGSRS